MNLFTKQKIDSQTQNTNFWSPKGKGKGRDKSEIWG